MYIGTQQGMSNKEVKKTGVFVECGCLLSRDYEFLVGVVAVIF
jgi:hypothetical protein